MVRRLLMSTVIALTAAVAPAGVAQAAEACGRTLYCYTAYYSDSTYSTKVGSRTVYCDGDEVFQGMVTSWRKMVTRECDGPF